MNVLSISKDEAVIQDDARIHTSARLAARFPLGENPMRFITLFAICTAMASAQPFTASPDQGRSMITTQYGIVATPQFLASQAGARMLEAGGNGVDAAIAANAVPGATQPYANGIG